MRARLPLFLAAAAIAGLVLPLRAEHRAVLVGVSDYAVLDADLRGPANDVALMAEVLIGRGVPVAEMTVLTSQPGLLPKGVASAAPTRAGILHALDDVAARSRAGDTVVFYFSGHGAQAPDTSGDEGGGHDEIFLPADAAGWKGAVGAVENALTDDELQVWAQGLLARGVRLIGLIDACHSDTGFRDIGGAGVARGLSPADLGIPAGAEPVPPGPALPPLAGAFVFLYSSQSDQRSYEYPVGDSGLWQGAFTLRLADVLRRAPEMPWRQVLAATSAAMVQDAARQVPDGEGPLLDEALFGTAAPPRHAVSAGKIAAGLLQGLSVGDEVTLYGAASGGPALGRVTLQRVAAQSADLPKGAPAEALWAEVSLPAAPPPLRLAAARRADAADGFDYAGWTAALGPRATATQNADLVPVLVAGGLALAGADGVLDPAGPGTSPRVTPAPGETEATALARMLDGAGHALRLQKLFSSLAGRSLTGRPPLQLSWQRRPARGAGPDCAAVLAAEPVDPARGLAPCDQLWARITNTSGGDLDVSVLYFNADFSITPVWPRHGLSNRLAPGEAADAGVQIGPAAAMEEIFVLAVPVVPGAARVDLTRLAAPAALRGAMGGAGWFADRLEAGAASAATRGFTGQPAALHMVRQLVRVGTAP